MNRSLIALLTVVIMTTMGRGQPRAQPQEAAPALRQNQFDSDPKWESYRARLLREQPPRRTRQAFGYSRTNRARGRSPGEIGGFIQRSVTPAWYAAVIPKKTLYDTLRASGRFAVTQAEGGSGMLFGWFHQDSRGWRTSNSLAFRLDGNGGNYWVFYEYGTRHWLTGGAGCFEGDAYQTTRTRPFAGDGTAHDWTLEYDPNGNQGNGQVTFTLDGTSYLLPLPPGHKEDGATFNRFGMFNQQTSGDGIEVYFDDVVLDGKQFSFEEDPRWDTRANRGAFLDRFVRPLHDFGFSPTRFAGSRTGEIGGVVWRDEPSAYYADRVGPLSLQDELYAAGKIVLRKATSDSAVYLGWFDARSKQEARQTPEGGEQKNFLGVLIEGPSRVGHYFRAAFGASQGKARWENEGPIIQPDGKAHNWSLRYTPGRGEGKGKIVVRLDGEERVTEVEPEVGRAGAVFDRFGLFNFNRGGLFVEIYLDDVQYTVGKRRSSSGIEEADGKTALRELRREGI